MLWMDYLAIIAGVLLITSVLLQSSQDDIKDAFSGEKSELFKNKKTRGFDLFMMRATAVFSIILVVMVLISNNFR